MQRRTFLRQTAVGLTALGASTLPVFAAGWKEGTPIPPLSTFGLEGALPNLKGKVVYLDFWASWCGPCKVSFPVLNKWHSELGAKGFTVLAVSVDENAADMHDFLTKTHVSFPVVRDAGHKLVAAANVSSMPTAFLIDRAGTIRQVHNGFRKTDEAPLAEQINALLGKA